MVNKKNIDMDIALMGKTPPYAAEMERVILGSIMLEAEAFHRISGIIDSECFYVHENRIIFDVVKDLAAKNRNIDLVTVARTLKDSGKLNEVGGPVYVTQLTKHVASAANIEFHARIIAQKFMQRELIRISSEIQTQAYDDSEDVDDLISSARHKLNEVDNLFVNANTGKISKVVAADALIEIEKDAQAANEGRSPGIPTGLKELDQSLGGWRKNNLIILAARPSVGKTSLALHFAKVAANSGRWVNFYGLEMKSEDLFRIMLSGETGISRSDIRDGNLSQRDWNALHQGTSNLEKLSIIWNDNPGITVNHIRSNTFRNQRAGKCDFVVIDYLQLVKPTDKKLIREQQIAEISRTLKEIALGTNIPILCLSQLNRDVEKRSDKEPNLSDIRESGAIEQDADVVLFLYELEGLKLKIGKNRRGKTGHIDFWANEEKTYFADSSPIDNPSLGIPVANESFYETTPDNPF